MTDEPAVKSPLVLAALIVARCSRSAAPRAAKLITGKDIKDHSITGKDIKKASIPLSALRTAAGPPGRAGPKALRAKGSPG